MGLRQRPMADLGMSETIGGDAVHTAVTCSVTMGRAIA
jgi:hypothetical protein